MSASTRRRTVTLAFSLALVGLLAVLQGWAGVDPAPDVAGAAAVEPYVAGGVCLSQATPAQLGTLFATEPGGVAGADYQRATELPNGDVLWTFQDAEVRRADGTLTLVHNIGMVQRGSCFSVLMSGNAANPQPWLFAGQTAPFQTWYWPLDAVLGDDGRLYVFAARMTESGTEYLTEVTPTATAVAAFDPTSWNLVFQGSPADSSPALYGWSAESVGEWTYLYAQCHRQFGFDIFLGVRAHDRGCADKVTLARTRRGRIFDSPEYWTGTGWSRDGSRATPVFETAGRMVNPADIVFRNNQWISVTKVDDWFGRMILVETAPRASGPFETIATLSAAPKCSRSVCNTYYASWIPTGNPQQALIIGLSHNRWDGVFSTTYHPTFRWFDTPDREPSPADRCSIGHCD